MSDSTRGDDDSKGRSRPRYVLAPGASDPSEGVAPDVIHHPVEPTGGVNKHHDPDMEYREYATRQPGEGFWALAPGAGDISEGMVWVAIQPRSK